MDHEQMSVPAAQAAGQLAAAGDYVAGFSQGEYFAVTRWCRHRNADLAGGTVDADGCLVCPLHGARYDVRTGRAVDGPKIPAAALARWIMNRHPLERRDVQVDGDTLRIR